VEKGDSAALHDAGQGGRRIVKSDKAYAAATAFGFWAAMP
jgi:hypothetical protein